MRILLLWDYYPAYLRQFYLHRPNAPGLTFAQQMQLLLEDGFNWPAYLIPEFRRQGHEAVALVGNAEPAQKAWGQENGFTASASPAEIVREQIRRFRPDILWLGGAERFLGEFLQSVRKDCGAVVAWRAAAGGEKLDWNGVDCILSSHQNFVDVFRGLGLRSELVLPCVDPEMMAGCLAEAPPRDRGVTFYGTLSASLFTNRLQFLSSVTRHVRCHVHSEGLSWQRRPRPLGLFLGQLRYVPFRIQTRFEPPVYGWDLRRLIARSKIVLNAHVDSAAGLAGNIRMFETTAMGALLMTDASPNVAEIFEPGREIVTYESAADAVEKLRYYLSHPEEREAIAQAGQRKALARYSTRVRAQGVLEIFENLVVANGIHGS